MYIKKNKSMIPAEQFSYENQLKACLYFGKYSMLSLCKYLNITHIKLAQYFKKYNTKFLIEKPYPKLFSIQNYWNPKRIALGDHLPLHLQILNQKRFTQLMEENQHRIRRVAKIANISTQRIYQLLNSGKLKRIDFRLIDFTNKEQARLKRETKKQTKIIKKSYELDHYPKTFQLYKNRDARINRLSSSYKFLKNSKKADGFHSFENFVLHMLELNYHEIYTYCIENNINVKSIRVIRIDSNKLYEKGNVKISSFGKAIKEKLKKEGIE